jgi:hypothetical protein
MVKTVVNELTKALNFVARCHKDKGAAYQTHALINNNEIKATNGVLTLSHPISESLTACPHTTLLETALKKTKESFSLTMKSASELQVKSGRLRTTVPCLPSIEMLPTILPDPLVASLTEEFAVGVRCVSPFVKENSPHIITASALLSSGSISCTSGPFLLEYWHGVSMPTLCVPKPFLTVVGDIKDTPIGFGFSATSLTIHYADNRWIKTQLYQERWPDLSAVLNRPHKQTPVPAALAEGIATVSGYNDSTRLYFRDGYIRSASIGGAEYEIPELAGVNVILGTNDLSKLISDITHLDIIGADGVSFFYGKNFRGAISHIKE